ncbi:MAG: hypothetical protein ACOX9B_15025 [Candidatus Xenobium sp.]|jgi:hypothetical protein|nr:hypothetical protein [Burkholderiales bacterium]
MSRLAHLFIAVLLLFGAASLSAAPVLAPPRLVDIRVWSYASGSQDSAQTVLWWLPEGLQADRPDTFTHGSLLRVRVLVTGGLDEDRNGTLNWLSVVFHDATGAEFELPMERRETRAGVKDICWRIPLECAPGPLHLEVLAWGDRPQGPTRAMSPADRSGKLKLGRVAD